MEIEIISTDDLSAIDTDLLGVPVFAEKPKLRGLVTKLDGRLRGEISRIVELGDFKAEKEEVLILYPKGLGAKRLALVGCGKKAGADALRIAGGALAKKATDLKLSEIALYVLSDGDLERNVEASLIAIGMAIYSFRRYKEEKEKAPKKIKIVTERELDDPKGPIDYAKAVIEGVYLARDVANTPPSDMNPESFERVAAELAKEEGFKIEVLHKEELEKLGMGGILGVGRGSSVPPRLIILEYRGVGEEDPPVVIVGKGITFDSGGLNLKPAQAMQDMKYDKSGAADVLGVMKTVSRLKLPINVVGLIPLAENMPGEMAYKPSDVLTMYNKMTVEVSSTDAEGRLVLADALAYAVDKYKPRAVIDLATLTGAMVIALGNHGTGLFSNDDALARKIQKAAERAGEKVWRFPLWEEYYDQLKSDVADLSNSGGREGGAITAAAFLSKFVRNTPWAHLDIAGTAWVQEKGPKAAYYPKGATAIGVYTITELLRDITGEI